jgi:hypothetical protein
VNAKYNGTWLLNFNTPGNSQPFGGGIVYIYNGEFVGGDSVVVFAGNIVDDAIEVKTKNARTVPGMINTLPGGVHKFLLTGDPTTDTFTLTHPKVVAIATRLVL